MRQLVPLKREQLPALQSNFKGGEMPINKVIDTFEEAVKDIRDGAVILLGNFAGPGGTPINLIKALRDRGVKDLTIVANTAGGIGLTLDFDDHRILFQNSQVTKVIATFPFSTSPKRPTDAEKQILAGQVELELVPQGTLAERLRAGGAGIPAFFTPTGVGTVVEEGKERRYFEGRPYIMEAALKADYAFVRAYKADRKGNLIFRGTQRQFNPVMATAARITIAEVDEIVESGEIDPNCVITPGIFVSRIVRVKEDPGFPRHLETNFQVREGEV
jgi:3-oxoacid CoA-transferase A subunit